VVVVVDIQLNQDAIIVIGGSSSSLESNQRKRQVKLVVTNEGVRLFNNYP
jgi:hypothetical protein